jgi:hypothetical protein
MRIKQANLVIATWLAMIGGIGGCIFALVFVLPDTISIATGDGHWWGTLLYLIPAACIFVSVEGLLLRAIVREKDVHLRFVLARWSLYMGFLEAIAGVALWFLTAALIPGSLY